MHRALSSRWLSSALRTTERPATWQIPLFLCPRLGTSSQGLTCRPSRNPPRRPPPWRPSCRGLQTQAEGAAPAPSAPALVPIRKLPVQCSGCGALSQTVAPDQPGYFDLERKAVRQYLGIEQPKAKKAATRAPREEDLVYQAALERLGPAELEKLGFKADDEALAAGQAGGPVPVVVPTEPQLREKRGSWPSIYPTPEPVIDLVAAPEKPPKVPLCDRCHSLLHHSVGKSIYHPTVDSVKDTLDESPYKYNHVYHILDAADFPMSILPRIHTLLDLMPLRTKNRRSSTGRFYHNQKTEMSFVITRSDLLAPTKPQVDRLLPYLREVLREELGRAGRDLRLGNVRCVSSRRSWWTKELKEEIWRRGGAGWMVGKVNVGKSQLFEAVFPKGRMDWIPTEHQISVDMYGKDGTGKTQPPPESILDPQNSVIERVDDPGLDEFSLLPPAPAETQYPQMPLVSDLPGTTASPIRVPFGNGRGELIDLPGLERTGLEKYVKDENRLDLVMRSRIVPEQIVIKQGQSLLLGGLIRITPRVPGPIVMSYAFTPIQPHLTRTEKAVEIQGQTSELNVETIAAPGTGETVKLAGSFPLKWDVTRERAGPVTNKNLMGFKVERLSWRVMAADILIEGVGWVEVVAQVRTKDLYAPPPKVVDPAGATVTSTAEFLEMAGSPEPRKDSPAESFEDSSVSSFVEDAASAPETDDKVSALERLEALGEDPAKKERTTPPPAPAPDRADGELNWPIVDVYSPEGKFIGVRRPMNGWLLNKPRVTAAHQRSRPRKSMKGQKKLEKQRRREREAAGSF